MVFTPITGLGGRVVVPRAGRASSTRCISSLSASHGGNGGNGLRRTGGNGEGGDSGKARLALSGASLALSLVVAGAPAVAAPKKGKPVVPELTQFDLAVRASFPVQGRCDPLQFSWLTHRNNPGTTTQKQVSSTTALSAGVGYGSALLVKVRETGGRSVSLRSTRGDPSTHMSSPGDGCQRVHHPGRRVCAHEGTCFWLKGGGGGSAGIIHAGTCT
jgi:hypothetical protein